MKSRFVLLALGLAAAIASAAGSAISLLGVDGPRKGVVLGVFDLNRASEAYQHDLKEIRALGANSVALPVYWYQNDVRSVDIHPYRGREFNQRHYDALLRSIISQAHDEDLAVFLMPIVQLEHVGPGQWRGALQPMKPSKWFNSYRKFVGHYARLAEEADVELFSVGSELSSMEAFSTWSSIIAKVREVYSGELTYSANWDHYDAVPFWDDLDVVGLSGYYELSAELPPTYSSLRRAWQSIREELVTWQQGVGKPLLFTEIGYPSNSTAAHKPWDYTLPGYADLDLQRLCYKAFIDTWQGAPELGGTFLWIWEPERGGAGDLGYSWQGKPAEREIAKWYRNS